MANGTYVKGVGLNTDTPWDHCWSLLLTPQVKNWWIKKSFSFNSNRCQKCCAICVRGCQHQRTSQRPFTFEQAENHHRTATVVQTSARRVDRSEQCRQRIRISELATHTTQAAVQVRAARFALRMTTSCISAASATVQSTCSWIARNLHRRKRRPTPVIQRLLGPRSQREAQAEARRDAMDTEATTLKPCMHRRASQFMSQFCLRRMLLRFGLLLRRDTRWPLR